MKNSAQLRQILRTQVEWEGAVVLKTGSPRIGEFRMKLRKNQMVNNDHHSLKPFFFYQRFSGIPMYMAEARSIHSVVQHHKCPVSASVSIPDFEKLILDKLGEDLWTHEVFDWLRFMGEPAYFHKYRRTGHIPFPRLMAFNRRSVLSVDDCATAYKSLVYRRLFLTKQHEKMRTGVTLLHLFLAAFGENDFSLMDFTMFLRKSYEAMIKHGIHIIADYGHEVPLTIKESKVIIKSVMESL